MKQWQTGKPPDLKVVEVKLGNKIIRARAIWGRDGILPHWETEDSRSSSAGCLFPPHAFAEWRELEE